MGCRGAGGGASGVASSPSGNPCCVMSQKAVCWPMVSRRFMAAARSSRATTRSASFSSNVRCRSCSGAAFSMDPGMETQ
eukprot:3836232-Alexandrium_andersonii.AAC.1